MPPLQHKLPKVPQIRATPPHPSLITHCSTHQHTPHGARNMAFKPPCGGPSPLHLPCSSFRCMECLESRPPAPRPTTQTFKTGHQATLPNPIASQPYPTIVENGKIAVLRVIPALTNPLVAHDGSVESCGQPGFIAYKNLRILVLIRFKIRIKGGFP